MTYVFIVQFSRNIDFHFSDIDPVVSHSVRSVPFGTQKKQAALTSVSAWEDLFFFPKILILKKKKKSPLGESFHPTYTTIIYYLIIAIINKSFEFQNDCLKIIPVRYNCTQFCPIPLC